MFIFWRFCSKGLFVVHLLVFTYTRKWLHHSEFAFLWPFFRVSRTVHDSQTSWTIHLFWPMIKIQFGAKRGIRVFPFVSASHNPQKTESTGSMFCGLVGFWKRDVVLSIWCLPVFFLRRTLRTNSSSSGTRKVADDPVGKIPSHDIQHDTTATTPPQFHLHTVQLLIVGIYFNWVKNETFQFLVPLFLIYYENTRGKCMRCCTLIAGWMKILQGKEQRHYLWLFPLAFFQVISSTRSTNPQQDTDDSRPISQILAHRGCFVGVFWNWERDKSVQCFAAPLLTYYENTTKKCTRLVSPLAGWIKILHSNSETHHYVWVVPITWFHYIDSSKSKHRGIALGVLWSWKEDCSRVIFVPFVLTYLYHNLKEPTYKTVCVLPFFVCHVSPYGNTLWVAGYIKQERYISENVSTGLFPLFYQQTGPNHKKLILPFLFWTEYSVCNPTKAGNDPVHEDSEMMIRVRLLLSWVSLKHRTNHQQPDLSTHDTSIFLLPLLFSYHSVKNHNQAWCNWHSPVYISRKDIVNKRHLRIFVPLITVIYTDDLSDKYIFFSPLTKIFNNKTTRKKYMLLGLVYRCIDLEADSYYLRILPLIWYHRHGKTKRTSLIVFPFFMGRKSKANTEVLICLLSGYSFTAESQETFVFMSTFFIRHHKNYVTVFGNPLVVLPWINFELRDTSFQLGFVALCHYSHTHSKKGTLKRRKIYLLPFFYYSMDGNHSSTLFILFVVFAKYSAWNTLVCTLLHIDHWVWDYGKNSTKIPKRRVRIFLWGLCTHIQKFRPFTMSVFWMGPFIRVFRKNGNTITVLLPLFVRYCSSSSGNVTTLILPLIQHSYHCERTSFSFMLILYYNRALRTRTRQLSAFWVPFFGPLIHAGIATNVGPRKYSVCRRTLDIYVWPLFCYTRHTWTLALSEVSWKEDQNVSGNLTTFFTAFYIVRGFGLVHANFNYPNHHREFYILPLIYVIMNDSWKNLTQSRELKYSRFVSLLWMIHPRISLLFFLLRDDYKSNSRKWVLSLMPLIYVSRLIRRSASREWKSSTCTIFTFFWLLHPKMALLGTLTKRGSLSLLDGDGNTQQAMIKRHIVYLGFLFYCDFCAHPREGRSIRLRSLWCIDSSWSLLQFSLRSVGGAAQFHGTLFPIWFIQKNLSSFRITWISLGLKRRSLGEFGYHRTPDGTHYTFRLTCLWKARVKRYLDGRVEPSLAVVYPFVSKWALAMISYTTSSPSNNQPVKILTIRAQFLMRMTWRKSPSENEVNLSILYLLHRYHNWCLVRFVWFFQQPVSKVRTKLSILLLLNATYRTTELVRITFFWIFFHWLSLFRYSKHITPHRHIKFGVFPFFRYDRLSGEYSKWCFLPLVPVKYSFLASVCAYEKHVSMQGVRDEEGTEDKSTREESKVFRFLYRVIRFESEGKSSRIEANPIIFYDKSEHYSVMYLLGGCVGRERRRHRKRTRFCCCVYV
uniref:Uncharacterized protein n=1 Tax=Percolomonas cosmopolitus TaxID=63605 RepID=A0A7S1KKN5_9EUKA